MNYEDIETFLTIVVTKNITKAANLLFLSQPTISNRLSALEHELGVSLFVRKKGNKNIQMTNDGDYFIPIANRWLALMKETRAMRERQENYKVTLGCTDSLSVAFLVPFYRQLINDKEKSIDICVRTHWSSELYGMLEDHEIDIAFVYNNLYFKNVHTEKYFQEKLYIVQNAQPVIKKDKIHTKELDPNKEIFLSWGDTYHIWHDQWITEANNHRIDVDTIAIAIQLWQENDEHWMIMPASAIKFFSQFRPFYVSEIENAPPDRICYKVVSKTDNIFISRSLAYFTQKMDAFLKTTNFDIPLGICFHLR